MLSRLKQNISREISTISTTELESKQWRPQFSRLCSVRRAIFSASAVALGVFDILSKGYYHSVSFSRFLPQTLRLPTFGVWRNVEGASGGHLAVKQEKPPQIQKAAKAVLSEQNIRQFKNCTKCKVRNMYWHQFNTTKGLSNWKHVAWQILKPVWRLGPQQEHAVTILHL